MVIKANENLSFSEGPFIPVMEPSSFLAGMNSSVSTYCPSRPCSGTTAQPPAEALISSNKRLNEKQNYLARTLSEILTMKHASSIHISPPRTEDSRGPGGAEERH